MMKIVIIAFATILLIGCASQTSPFTPKQEKKVKIENKININIAQKKHVHHKMKMFQTVDAKDAVLVQKGDTKNFCVNCGMNLTKFYKTNHISVVDGVARQYCSIHCLTKDLNAGDKLLKPKVVDVSSLKFIDVWQAYYVVGSSKPGTMSRVSKYAFSKLEDAQKFQKNFGGKIYDFNEALRVAKEDFKAK